VGDIARIMGVPTTRGILRSSNQAIIMIGYWEPGTGTGRIIIAKKLPVCRAFSNRRDRRLTAGDSNANGTARRVMESGLLT
jgi:hypothetical protein